MNNCLFLSAAINFTDSGIIFFPPQPGDEGEKFIHYSLPKSRTYIIFSYDSILYSILQMDKLKPCMNKQSGRLYFKVRESPTAKDETIQFSDLACACYHGWIREDHFLVDLKEFIDYKNANNLEVDHADSDTRNNTKWNLSLMPRTCNKQKGNITKRVKLPAMLLTCYSGGEYRIYYERAECHDESITSDENGFILYMQLSCSNPDTYVKTLNDIADGRIFVDGNLVAEQLRNKKHTWAKTGRAGVYDEDVMVSIQWQRWLSSMEKSEFHQVG